jgi:Ca2+-binding EF-hand superfamily protein
MLDTNQDGSISLQELKDALATQLESVVSEEVALKIMKRFDTSGDGAIQLDEFKGD